MTKSWHGKKWDLEIRDISWGFFAIKAPLTFVQEKKSWLVFEKGLLRKGSHPLQTIKLTQKFSMSLSVGTGYWNEWIFWLTRGVDLISFSV